MPRELWAKIAVEIVRDPKLLERQPWERWLWLGLICMAKELAEEDGILRRVTPRTLASVLDLRVAPSKVAAALKAFEVSGMVRLLPDGSVELIHFKKRQIVPKDSPEAVRERQRQWREMHKSNGAVTGSVTGRSNGAVTGEVTGSRSVTRNGEEEVEEEKSSSEAGSLLGASVDGARSAGPPPPPFSAPPEKQKPAESAPPPTWAETSPLVAYLAATWPALGAPEKVVPLWRDAWPGVNLLAEAKKARAYELETGKMHSSPGSFLRSWFRRAPAESANSTKPTSAAKGSHPETIAALNRTLRPTKEMQAGEGSNIARAWLHKRWPEIYPPPEDAAAWANWQKPAESSAESHA